MTDFPCPMGDGRQLGHPDALFCTPCTHQLPQRLRRAIARANRGETDRGEVLERCRTWLARREVPQDQ